MGKLADIVGHQFNYLKVLERHGGNKNATWLCLCECGKTTIVSTCHLKSNHTKSCGCHKENVIRNGTNTTHGQSKNGNRTYKTWKEMRSRCNGKYKDNYKYYGELGITICEEWNDFLKFVEDMGERPIGKTLDRINPFGNYEKNNCRWATHKEQMNNLRKHWEKNESVR